MSIDRSLKIKDALQRHRNVLKRAERVEKLKDEEQWSEENSVFGLPKVAHRKSHAGKKAVETKTAEQEAAAVQAPQPEAEPKTKAKSKES